MVGFSTFSTLPLLNTTTKMYFKNSSLAKKNPRLMFAKVIKRNESEISFWKNSSDSIEKRSNNEPKEMW